MYSSANDAITEIVFMYISVPVDCSSAVGTKYGQMLPTYLASQQQHSPNSINMTATATATEIPIPAGQMRKNAQMHMSKTYRKPPCK